MKPLKIVLPVHCFFPDHFYGTETYTLELAQRLKALGHHPTILSAVYYGEKGPGASRFAYEYGGLTVDCIDLNTQPLYDFRQTYSRPNLYPVIKDILRERQPDIVHVTHLMGHTGVLLEVVRDLKLPAVATLTDFFGICPNSKLISHAGGLCMGPDSRSTNCLSCFIKGHQYLFSNWKKTAGLIRNDWSLPWVSRAVSYLSMWPGKDESPAIKGVRDAKARIDYLRKLYDVYACMITSTDFLHEAYVKNRFYPDKLKKINFGINLGMVKAYRKTFASIPSHVHFGYIGQITSHKGVDLLVKAFSTLKGAPAKLSIYGPRDQDAAYMENLRGLISSSRCAIQFKDTFPKDQLGKVLADIDVLVIPSRWYENSPLVLLYAQATKTPVIVTDTKGMNEFVQNGKNGFTFEKDNAAHLGRIMQQIVDQPALLLDLSKNSEYSMDVEDYAEHVLHIYEDVLNRRV